MNIEANIKSLKIWKNDISIEAIDGGLTNQNFLVTDGEKKYMKAGDKSSLPHLNKKITS